MFNFGSASAGNTLDGHTLDAKPGFLNPPAEKVVAGSSCSVYLVRYTACATPHDGGDFLLHRYLPFRLTQDILNSFTEKGSPYDVTQDNVPEALEAFEMEFFSGHQSVCGHGGDIAVIYQDHNPILET